MDDSSAVPQITRYLQTLGGLPPKIVRVDGFFLWMTCPMCGKEYSKRLSLLTWAVRQGNQTGMACSRHCGTRRRAVLTPEVFTQSGEKKRGVPATGKWAKGSVRGPLTDERRAHLSKVLKAKGHKPLVRGGNGTGMTPAEALLASTLEPLGFQWNLPIALGKGCRQAGYPPAYKVDFGCRARKLALEVDGQSHRLQARQEQDRKKEARLKELGWSVFRVANEAVLTLFSTSKSPDVRTILPAVF